MVHEVMDTTLAPAEMEEQVRSHKAPTESRSPAHRCIRIRDAEYILIDQVNDFAIESCLKTVRDVANHLFLHVNRSLTDRGIERIERSIVAFDVFSPPTTSTSGSPCQSSSSLRSTET